MMVPRQCGRPAGAPRTPPPGLLLLLSLVVGVGGLRDVRVSVPAAAVAGSTVTLACRYDLETDVLYSVKWYKGRHEFYRYIPKELPHTRVFPLEGVDVDIGRSGPATVVLRGVLPSLSGRYRCEVSADAPSFHTAMKTSYMHVIEVPLASEQPQLVAERARLGPGERLRARCTAPPAHPPANITWLLNGIVINGSAVELLPIEETFPEDNAEHRAPERDALHRERGRRGAPLKRRAASELDAAVAAGAVRGGVLRLGCRASLFSVWSAYTETSVQAAERPQIASVLVLATGHTHSGSPGRLGLGLVALAAPALMLLWR